MDLAKNVLFRKVVITGRAPVIFSEFWLCSPPTLSDSFKITAPTRMYLDYREGNRMANEQAAPAAPFVVHHTLIGKGALKTLWIGSQWRSEHFFYSRLPFVNWKSRDECSASLETARRVFYRHWLGRNSVQYRLPMQVEGRDGLVCLFQKCYRPCSALTKPQWIFIFAIPIPYWFPDFQ